MMKDFVSSYMSEDSSGRKLQVAGVTSKISSGDGNILELVEALETDLTHTEVDKRIKACEMMSDVLSMLHFNHIKPKEASVLMEFLCLRLKDHYSIHSAALSSLSSLSQHPSLPEGTAGSILRSMFKEVHTPSYMQSDRRAVYGIMTNLLENNKEEVLKLGNDFVYGVITAVDGEQDPRNLLKVFDLAYDITTSGFDLSKFAEEFFEIVGCYFPIDFEPPTSLSENHQAITNKQLVTALRKVLASTSVFAPFCLPMLVEKMESDVQSAKLDAMTTLKDCLLVYSITDLKPHLRSLWVCIRKEVVYAQTEEIEKLGEVLIKDMVSVLARSSDSKNTESELEVFLKDMLEDCLPRLVEHLHEKTSWSSAKLLIAAAEASKEACQKVLSAMTPVLLKHVDRDSKVIVAEKRLAMEILVNVTKSAAAHDFSDAIESHPLYKYKDDIIDVFCGCVSSHDFILLRTVALAGVAALCNLGILVSPEDQLTIVRSIIYCIENEKDPAILDDVRIATGYLSSKWLDVAINHIIPVLQKTVSNVFTVERPVAELYLSHLSAISSHIDVVSVTCGLLEELICSEDVNEKNASMIELCLSALCVIVKQNVDDVSCLGYFAGDLVFLLVKTCVRMSLVSVLPEQCCSCCSDSQAFSSQCVTWPIMQKVCEILRTICQRMRPGQQADNICKNMSDIFLNHNLGLIGLNTQESSFGPFLYDKLPLQTRLVSLLTATLCSFHKDINIGNVDVLLDNLLHLCQATDDQPSYVSASKCLSGLLNKQNEPSPAVLNKVFQLSSSVIEDSSTHDKRISKFCLLVWVTKGLVLRSHPRMMDFTNILFQLFADRKLGRMAADSFDIILRETDEVLHPASHACVRLMYQQRYFQLVLPKLTACFRTLEKGDEFAMEVDDGAKDDALDVSAVKANYLTALSHLLMFIPKQVLRQHLTTLLPLLMKSLNTEEGPSLVSVLSTLYSLVQEAKSAVEPHVEMLSEHFLRLSVPPFDMKIRIQALQCIGVLTLLQVNVLLPHKKRMIRSLASPLDDRKRLVRKEAVKARTQWCLVGDA